jgi:hypothetical protein
MNRTLIVAVLPLVAALSGCSTLYAEAEQAEVCLTLPPQTITIPGGGVVAPPGGFSGSYSGVVDVGLSDALPDFLIGGSPDSRILRFLSLDASLVPAPGVNFDWLSDLEVRAEHAADAPVTLARFARGTRTGLTTISLLPAHPDVNLAGFLTGGSVALQLAGSVDVPAGRSVPPAWTATVSACFYAKVKKTFQELANGT